jgi:putative ABC transport system permease protein
MLLELARQAYNALKHNRRRSVLTMLGMAWGIATVVLLLALRLRFRARPLGRFPLLGHEPGLHLSRTHFAASGRHQSRQRNQTHRQRSRLPSGRSASAQAHLARGLQAKHRRLWNAERQLRDQRSLSVLFTHAPHGRRSGTFFTDLDENTHSRVAILGADVKKKLFSGQNALGEKVRLDGISYDVIGVLKRVIQNGDDNMNGKVYIPFSAMNDLTNTYYLNAIAMEYEGDHEKIAAAVRRSMAFHHEFDPKDKRAIFVFDVFADLLDLRVITTGIKILLGFIGLLTLGIGGVGLMNIMLVSVTQRTREIGVEKALGARGWHILVQFLAEALVITLLGGLAGVVLAYIVSWSVGSLTLWSAFVENGTEGDIRLTIDSATLLASTVILGFVGVISGMLPAIKASRLDPIEALRYE